MSMKKLKGATVVITGASSGIGRATALRFAKAGSNVVLAARGRTALEEAAKEVRQHKVRALAVPTDISDEISVNTLARQAVEQFGGIDVWVNNASVTLFGAVDTVPTKDIRQVLDTNVMGYVHGSRAALGTMRKQKRGVLINVSSAVANVPQPYTAAYSMSKAATSSLSVSLRSELWLDGLKNIHVVNVIPPSVDTPLFGRAANYSGRKARAMPPVYPPERIAKAIVKAATKPEPEVPVGPGAALIVKQHRAAPQKTERMMAIQTDKSHLSRKEAATPSSGNLYESLTADTDTVHGGWNGKRRSARRKIIGVGLIMVTAGAGVAGVAVANKLRPRLPGEKAVKTVGKKAVKAAAKGGAGAAGLAAKRVAGK